MTETLRTWRLLHELRRGVRRDPAALRRLQADLLRRAIGHAYERVPLYRRRFDEAGLDPASVRGPEDLGRVPTLSAAAARDGLLGGELLARGTDRRRLPAFPTSGTSGDPLLVPRGAIEQRLWRAVLLRTWFEHGYRWRHVTAQVDPDRGPGHFLQRLGVSRTVWISPELRTDEQAARLARAHADVVAGTPTALRRIARDAPIDPPRARAVFCHGEVIDTRTSALIRGRFGVPPAGVYGLTELGAVAWQCERLDGYHVNADTCLVEVVRDGRPATPGELGSVVVTDLRGRTAPLIRYETGDLAVAGERCACGRTLPVLASLEGRECDALALPDGRVVTSRRLVEHMADLLSPDRYVVRQDEANRFRIHLPQGSELGVAAHLRELLGRVEANTVEGLPAGHDATLKSYPVVALRPAAPARADGLLAAPAP